MLIGLVFVVAVIDVVVIYSCCKSAGLREQAAKKAFSALKQKEDRQ